MSEPDTRLSKFAAAADDDDQAQHVGERVYVSRGMGNSVLIAGSGARVIINAGLPDAGPRHRARFDRVSTAPITHLVLTQSHLNQFGGASALMDADTQVVAQARYLDCRRRWIALRRFYARRSRKLWSGVLRDRTNTPVKEVVPDVTFLRDHRLEVGGRRFELHSTPGGESSDALIVWLPQDRLAVTGNLFGPIFGHLPNLYTIRGDRIRSATAFIDSLELVRGLSPQTLITGHQVLRGGAEIQATLVRVRDAVRHLYDRTIEGMNEGRDVHA